MNETPENLDQLAELLSIQESTEALAIRLKEVVASRNKMELLLLGYELGQVTEHFAAIIDTQCNRETGKK
jgi:hypothetical protein